MRTEDSVWSVVQDKRKFLLINRLKGFYGVGLNMIQDEWQRKR